MRAAVRRSTAYDDNVEVHFHSVALTMCEPAQYGNQPAQKTNSVFKGSFIKEMQTYSTCLSRTAFCLASTLGWITSSHSNWVFFEGSKTGANLATRRRLSFSALHPLSKRGYFCESPKSWTNSSRKQMRAPLDKSGMSTNSFSLRNPTSLPSSTSTGETVKDSLCSCSKACWLP